MYIEACPEWESISFGGMDLKNQSPRWRLLEGIATIGVLATVIGVAAALVMRIVTHGPLVPAFPSVTVAIELLIMLGMVGALRREKLLLAIVLLVIYVLVGIGATIVILVSNPPF